LPTLHGLAFLGEPRLDGSVRRVPARVLVAARRESTPVVPPG
jgi:hypothetical protein